MATIICDKTTKWQHLVRGGIEGKEYSFGTREEALVKANELHSEEFVYGRLTATQQIEVQRMIHNEGKAPRQAFEAVGVTLIIR